MESGWCRVDPLLPLQKKGEENWLNLMKIRLSMAETLTTKSLEQPISFLCSLFILLNVSRLLWIWCLIEPSRLGWGLVGLGRLLLPQVLMIIVIWPLPKDAQAQMARPHPHWNNEREVNDTCRLFYLLRRSSCVVCHEQILQNIMDQWTVPSPTSLRSPFPMSVLNNS